MRKLICASTVFLAGAASADMIGMGTKHAALGQVVFNSCGSCHATDLQPDLMNSPVLCPSHDGDEADVAAYLAALAVR